MTEVAPVRRLTPIPLPPATYVPGRSGKAQRQQSQRWLGQHLATAWGAARAGTSVRENLAWLYGIDLFHAGCFWEAHEAWEPLWRAAPEHSAERRLLQALLQWAASLVQLKAGRVDAAKRLAQRALARVGQVDASRCLDVDVAHARACLRSYLEWLEEGPAEAGAAETLRPRLRFRK